MNAIPAGINANMKLVKKKVTVPKKIAIPAE